jgi:hypothetical protein
MTQINKTLLSQATPKDEFQMVGISARTPAIIIAVPSWLSSVSLI